ncbi:hypothetical protein HK099_004344, partial [Clydaea vesicula]
MITLEQCCTTSVIGPVIQLQPSNSVNLLHGALSIDAHVEGNLCISFPHSFALANVRAVTLLLAGSQLLSQKLNGVKPTLNRISLRSDKKIGFFDDIQTSSTPFVCPGSKDENLLLIEGDIFLFQSKQIFTANQNKDITFYTSTLKKNTTVYYPSFETKIQSVVSQNTSNSDVFSIKNDLQNLVFPFKFGKLSKNLPGSFHTDYSSVEYSLCCVVECFDNNSFFFKEEIPVPLFNSLAVFPRNTEFSFSNAAPHNSSDIISCDLVVPSTVISFGENIEILLCLNSIESGFEIHGVKMEVKQTTTYLPLVHETHNSEELPTYNENPVSVQDLLSTVEIKVKAAELYKKILKLPVHNIPVARGTYDSTKIKVQHQLDVSFIMQENSEKFFGSKKRKVAFASIPITLHYLRKEVLKHLIAYAQDCHDETN